MDLSEINFYQIDLYLNQVINKILPEPGCPWYPPSLQDVFANPILIDFLYNEVKSAYSNITTISPNFPFHITYDAGLDSECNKIYASSADIHNSNKIPHYFMSY